MQLFLEPLKEKLDAGLSAKNVLAVEGGQMICMGAGLVTEEDGGCLVGNSFVENELKGRKPI
jgi:hypothetical protein